MFWTSIQGSAFLFFRIFTSPLNSLYLYSFGGLFFSGWKRNSFFPLSPPSWLSLSSPLSSPPLIPSSSPLFSSEFPSFLFFSYPLLSHLILYFLQSSPPPYPHFSLTLSPLSIPSFFISSSLLPSSIFALILWQSLLLFPLQSSLLLYSSPKLITHSPYISYRALLYSALSSTSVCLLIFSGFHPLAMPPFALPLLSHSPSLPPPRPFTSQLLIQLSFLSQSDMSLNGAVENKILTKPRDLPASPFRLFIYSFVCVPLAPSPSPPSLQL